MRKFLKKACAVGLSTMMVVSLGACGSKAEGGNGSGSSNGKVKTFSVLMYTDWYKSGWKALEKHINDNSDKLGFKLKISKIQGGNQGDQVIKTKFASNDLPDIIQVYKPQWVETNAGEDGLNKLVDLTGLDSMSEYDQKALDGTYSYKGKLYGIPMDSVVLSGVFYNKKAFEKAGAEIPQTWDDFLSVCDKLKAAGITPVYYSAKDVWSVQPPTITGPVIDAAKNNETTFDLMKKIDTHELKYSDCTAFVDAIQKSKDLIDKGYVNSSYLSDTVDMAHEALAKGECGMYINGTWCADNIQQKFPDQSSDIGAFAIPQDDGDNYINMFTPYSLCLTKNCKDQKLGKKVMNYLASSEAQQIYADAQPGVYLNQKVKSDMPAATADLKKIMDSGKSMTDWEEINKYSYGNLGENVLDYYTGTLKKASDVTDALDKETAKSANAMGDKNWK
ncbi:ABC transporter substrate-binding protein [Lachnospiraceae bacterium YH-ros2228]